MDKKKIAGELVRIARDLVAGSGLYLVVGSRRRDDTLWPRLAKPELYSKREAQKLVDKMGSVSYGSNPIHWSTLELDNAHKQLRGKALSAVRRLQEEHLGEAGSDQKYGWRDLSTR